VKAGLQQTTWGGSLGQFHQNIDCLQAHAIPGDRVAGKLHLFILAFLWVVAGDPFPGCERKYQMHCSDQYISLVSNKAAEQQQQKVDWKYGSSSGIPALQK
jgi:hypothetical protein